MKNVSLVAFYGDKPPQLKDLIQQLQDYLANSELIKDKFIPYQLEQVHGTIIGCEGIKTKGGIISKWYSDRQQTEKHIDFASLSDYLQHQIKLPLTITFGGYDRHTDYKFLSRDRHPYLRSFQLQPADNQTIPVLIGWSCWDSQITMAIDNLRRSFEQFNLLHKYHSTPEAVDNDFYLRLGTIEAVLTAEARQKISKEICHLLETRSPLPIAIERENIATARYQDLSLTPATTKTIPIADLTTELLQQMYL